MPDSPKEEAEEPTDMNAARRESLFHYLHLSYPFTVNNDDGSFFIECPDLLRCMTQVEGAHDIAATARETRTPWIESEYAARGATIAVPGRFSDYCGSIF